MKITYYLTKAKTNNLYCRISDGAKKVSFPLGHTIPADEWDSDKQEGSHDDMYHYVLQNIKEYLKSRYEALKANQCPDVLVQLKIEIDTRRGDSGIENIAEKVFNELNRKDNVPEYKLFLQAFEQFSGLEKGEYRARVLGNIIDFHSDDDIIYEMDTYQGMTERLGSFIERRSYDEIQFMTEEQVWSDIFDGIEVEKDVLFPEMLRQWKIYWGEQYQRIYNRIGRTEHMDAMKEDSWRDFQVFMSCYDETDDYISLATRISDSILYPITVLAPMNIFETDTYFREYCNEAFSGEEWEGIVIDENDKEDAPLFFIRISEN